MWPTSRRPARATGLKGKGGVFHVTRGVGAAYPDRVWNSPLAEATILGTAMGYALGGWLPVIEIQFRDYIHPGWQQLVDEIATLRWRSNGTFACPMVIRVAYGDYLGGAGAIWHSEAAVGPMAHYPGLRVVVPGTAADAAGLLREAMASRRPGRLPGVQVAVRGAPGPLAVSRRRTTGCRSAWRARTRRART